MYVRTGIVWAYIPQQPITTINKRGCQSLFLMKKRKSFLLILLFISGMYSVSGQDFFQKKFEEQNQYRYQEKVYLQTDKSGYIAGETIWFSAYRVDAMNHLPGMYSKYIFVELYNRQNKLIKRIKIKENKGGFYGQLPLWKKLPLGEYCLKAYTNWMQNFDDAFYFQKNITIINPADLGVNSTATFELSTDSTVTAKIQILNSHNQPFPSLYTKCFFNQGNKTIQTKIVKNDNQGNFTLTCCPIKDSINNIQIKFLDKKPFDYQALFYVPEFSDDFDLQFMPEGGPLLAGMEQVVAFKTVGKDGWGVNVSGSIYNSRGEFTAPLLSVHHGMGRLLLNTTSGESYYALVKRENGLEKRFDLPPVCEEGIVLKVINTRESVQIAVLTTPTFIFPENLFLLLHSRGKLLIENPVTEELVSNIITDRLPDGVLHAALVDKNGKVYCERLLFINKEKNPELLVSTEKNEYASREEVIVQLHLQDTVASRLSVAVTDDSRVRQDSCADHILSNLLLCSDLKGDVEDPAWYFNHRISSKLRYRYLDLLMLTQGWKRFDIGKLCRGEMDTTSHFVEIRQCISGRLKNFWGKEAGGGTVCIVAPSIGLLKKTQTDPQGRFTLNALVFPDSTQFTIQGLSPQRGKMMRVIIDEENFKPFTTPLFHPFLCSRPPEKQIRETFSLFDNLKTNYYYHNGEKIYLLEEAKVIVPKKDLSYMTAIEKIVPDILYADEIREEKIVSVEEWLKSVALGIEFRKTAGTYTIWYGESRVKLFINDLYMRYSEDLEYIDMQDVEKIAFVKREDASRLSIINKGVINESPVILVYLKKGCVLDRGVRRADFFKYVPLGYQEPIQFYQPKYEVSEIKEDLREVDERRTIYWNPFIRMGKNGEGKISFYTADHPTSYTMIIEGVTDNGKIIRKETRIRRE